MDFRKDDIAVIKRGASEAGTELQVLGDPVFKEQWWVPVAHPNEEDPTFFKAALLELKTKRNYFLIKKSSRNTENSYILSTSKTEEELDADYIGEKLTDFDGAGAANGWEVSISPMSAVCPILLEERALVISGDNVFKIK